MKVGTSLIVAAITLAIVGCDSQSRSGYKGQGNPGQNQTARTRTQLQEAAPVTENLLAPIETVKNSIGMEMVLVPAGTFQMGSPDDEPGHQPGEFRRQVTIDKPFHISAHEVTQKQYAAVMHDNPSGFVGQGKPVENVSWNEAMQFCTALGELENETYRLPTEAEWEYACRAGTTTVFHYGDSLMFTHAAIDGRYPYKAKIKGPLPQSTKNVGTYEPNALGLYDMHGNVSEWCMDTLFNSGDAHIMRGGCGLSAPVYARAAYRVSMRGEGWQWTGFRVVKTDDADFEIPVAPPIERYDQFSTADMIAKIDKALSKPAEEYLPPVVIFPVVNDQSQVTSEGIGLGHLAAYATVCSPDRRIDLCLPQQRSVFANAGCYQYKPAWILDVETVRVCLAAMDARHFVLPQLIKNDQEWALKVSLRFFDDLGGDDQEIISEEIKLTPEKIADIPGMIARTVLTGMKAEVDEADWTAIETPQVTTAEDINHMGFFVADYAFGEENKTLKDFINRNPQSVAGWMMYVFESEPANEAIKQWEEDETAPRHDRLSIAVHVRNRGASMTQERVLELLKLAPKYKTDVYYLAALFHACNSFGQPELFEHSLNAWRQLDDSYGGKLLRGRILIDAAWDARGGSWASNVSEEGWRKFGERLQAAQAELEDAVAVNPLGFEAHAYLVTVCKGLGLSREYARQHFDAAKSIYPRSKMAYSNMYYLLQLRWGGTPAELIALAHECIDVGYWERGIPDIARDVVSDLTTDPGSHAVARSTYAHPQIWKIVQSYYESALKSGNEEWTKYAKSYFAKSGGYARKWKEVTPVFEQLEKEGIDERIFWDGFTYAYLRDRAFAAHAEGQVKIAARLRSALDDADLDEAEKQLELLEPSTEEEAKESDRYERVIALGRQLTKDRKITLSGKQILETFYGVDSRWTESVSEVLWNGPANSKTTITFPFGLKRVRVSGLVRWAGKPASVQFPLHTRSHRDLVFLKYDTERTNDIKLLRAKSRVEVDRLGEAKAQFRFTFTDEQDVIEPIPELTWTTPVFEDEPSGFAIRLETSKKGSLISINEISIELLDEE